MLHIVCPDEETFRDIKGMVFWEEADPAELTLEVPEDELMEAHRAEITGMGATIEKSDE